MKKLCVVLLVIVFMNCFIACGYHSAQSAERAVQPEATYGDDVYNVVMQIVTFGQAYEGIHEVEDAINTITVEEIGVSVTLLPVEGWNLSATTAQQITSGEKLDLMCVLDMGSGLDSIGNYAGRNLLFPLDDLYESYGKDIDSCIGELKQLGYYGGTLYGVPVNYLAGSGGGYLVRTDLMEGLGFRFETGSVYTVADLEPMFDAYREAYGDGHYAVASNPVQAVLEIDMLGDGSAGVLMNGGIDNLAVTNLFATEVYASYVKTAHEWYKKGYIHPDAPYITEAWPQLIASGNYLGAFVSFSGADGLDGMSAWESNSGFDLTAIKIVEDVVTTQTASYATWCIPATCENPEKTMQFLNLLYQDRELSRDIDSLLAVGIEGKTYQVAEEVGGSRAIITYADGVDYMTVPFEQAVPIYGNQLTVPKFKPLAAEIYEQFGSYNQDLKDAGRYSQAFGYVFDAAPVSAERAAVQNVISQYSTLLGYGVLSPDEALPKFLQNLKNAGIDAIITENQRQLNQWAAFKQ